MLNVKSQLPFPAPKLINIIKFPVESIDLYLKEMDQRLYSQHFCSVDPAQRL